MPSATKAMPRIMAFIHFLTGCVPEVTFTGVFIEHAIKVGGIHGAHLGRIKNRWAFGGYVVGLEATPRFTISTIITYRRR